ncbi:hypothetical protein [Tenacibaculum ovolyticum]|uniref:hypothetical protein n=1 Tax=Tenacibaculum ovolyticum TaxID=104270 RepID=UPI0007ECD322|nr:hypothetical protein [Tenacibaculum ovolyticum]
MINKNKKILFLLTLFLFISCNKNEPFDIKKEKNRDSLAFELCKIYGLDQGIRSLKPSPNKIKALKEIDAINFQRILAFVKVNGIPSEKLLGKKNMSQECVEASMIAVLLHTPNLLVNNKEYLDVFLKEVKKGNLKKETLVSILDKYYWVKRDSFGNRKLLYGSQFGRPCFKYRKKSDSVREIIGLEPLPDSLFINCKK